MTATWTRLGGALDYALFFAFAALNLVWFPLRNVSNAVDQYIPFETLEAVRRLGHIGLMLALLAGLRFEAFLIAANALWAIVFAICIARLARVGALARPRGVFKTLTAFWRGNRAEILRSGNSSIAELVISNLPPFLVCWGWDARASRGVPPGARRPPGLRPTAGWSWRSPRQRTG